MWLWSMLPLFFRWLPCVSLLYKIIRGSVHGSSNHMALHSGRHMWNLINMKWLLEVSALVPLAGLVSAPMLFVSCISSSMFRKLANWSLKFSVQHAYSNGTERGKRVQSNESYVVARYAAEYITIMHMIRQFSFI